MLKFLCIIFLVPVVQFIILQFTKAKQWSNHALVRNELIVLSAFYQSEIGWQIWFLPIMAEVIIEWASFKGYFRLDKPSLETDFIYSDFFESFTPDDETIRFYTEGDFKALGLADTTNFAASNIDKIMELGYSEREKPRSKSEIDQIMENSQTKKYEYILKQFDLKNKGRVLEIGFGKGDLMTFMKLRGIDPVGISVSITQVDKMKSLGYEVYHVDFWDIPKHPELHHQFDAVIMNGCTEYLLSWGEPRKKYKDAFNIIKSLLNPDSTCKRVYIASIHTKHSFYELPGFYNKWMQFFLSSGNSSVSTPVGQDGLTKYAAEEGFKLISQENRVFDYYLYSHFIACLWEKKRPALILKLFLKSIPLLICFPHFLQTVYAYTGFGIFRAPWIWQFTKQKDGYIPTDHLWIGLELQ